MLQIDPLKAIAATLVAAASIVLVPSCSSFGAGDTTTVDAGNTPLIDGSSDSGTTADASRPTDDASGSTTTDCTDTTIVLLGNSVTVLDTDSTGNGSFDAYPFTAMMGGTVHCAHVWIDALDPKSAVPGDTFEVGIYSDNEGAPGPLLAKAVLQLPSDPLPALVSGPFVASPALTLSVATNYWIAIGGAPGFTDEVDKNCGASLSDDGASELPATFPSGKTDDVCNLRAFVN